MIYIYCPWLLDSGHIGQYQAAATFEVVLPTHVEIARTKNPIELSASANGAVYSVPVEAVGSGEMPAPDAPDARYIS